VKLGCTVSVTGTLRLLMMVSLGPPGLPSCARLLDWTAATLAKKRMHSLRSRSTTIRSGQATAGSPTANSFDAPRRMQTQTTFTYFRAYTL
jgi:hypothetical protein